MCVFRLTRFGDRGHGVCDWFEVCVWGECVGGVGVFCGINVNDHGFRYAQIRGIGGMLESFYLLYSLNGCFKLNTIKLPIHFLFLFLDFGLDLKCDFRYFINPIIEIPVIVKHQAILFFILSIIGSSITILTVS